MRWVLLIASLTSAIGACTGMQPMQPREDAVLSGSETAKRAGDAAREAAKQNETGLIVASSSPPPPPEEPIEVKEPALPQPIKIEVASTGITLDGVVVSAEELPTRLGAKLNELPDAVVVIAHPDGAVDAERLAEIEVIAKDAGAKEVRIEGRTAEPTTQPTETPTPDSKPATPDAKAQPSETPTPAK